jgi:hypothetical protein
VASYKFNLGAAMNSLAVDPRTRFVGYGLKHGRAMGTLSSVPDAQIVETPVAENLMVGVAIGLSLRGLLPVVYFERCDFLTNALDAIVNHLDKAARLSRGEFTPALILRITVGNREKPLFTGAPHTQDFSQALGCMANNLWVGKLNRADSPAGEYYANARESQLKGESTALFEYKDLM